MDDEKRQQALDNFRNALGRLEQSDFKVYYRVRTTHFEIAILDIEFGEGTIIDWLEHSWYDTISNHTLRLKEEK